MAVEIIDPKVQETAPAALLSVIIPTFNERANVAPLVRRLDAVLEGVAWEAVFVDDDSPDGTAAAVKAIAARDGRVHCLRRIRRRGLAGAVVEGMLFSAAPYLAVIDADLQHDERLLPRMLERLGSGEADLVIASRYAAGGAAEGGLSAGRGLASRWASAVARLVLKAEVADPVSGFFMIRRELVDRVAAKLSDDGFKILFDIIACQPTPLRIVELPFAFAPRLAGESKFDARIAIDYLGLVLSRLTGGIAPPRALLFGLVGASGLVVHLTALRGALALGAPFVGGQAAAAAVAMTSNYFVNNVVTWRDRRLRGWGLLVGYLKFCGLCAAGLAANVAVAAFVHRVLPVWWLAGVAGALFGAVWNYVSTALAVW